MPTPIEPSAQEVQEHEVTHLPDNSWCAQCVRGKGKSPAHRAMDAEQLHSVPHVSLDYSLLGQEDEKALPIALIRDHASKSTFSHVVLCKGVEGSSCPAKQVAFSIAQLGHPKLPIKSDNEPAMLALKPGVSKLLKSVHGTDVVPEESPVESHQSNGVAEHAADELGGQVRSLNDQLQCDYKHVLPTNHLAYPWLINHAGSPFPAFKLESTGRRRTNGSKGNSISANLSSSASVCILCQSAPARRA